MHSTERGIQQREMLGLVSHAKGKKGMLLWMLQATHSPVSFVGLNKSKVALSLHPTGRLRQFATQTVTSRISPYQLWAGHTTFLEYLLNLQSKLDPLRHRN